MKYKKNNISYNSIEMSDKQLKKQEYNRRYNEKKKKELEDLKTQHMEPIEEILLNPEPVSEPEVIQEPSYVPIVDESNITISKYELEELIKKYEKQQEIIASFEKPTEIIQPIETKNGVPTSEQPGMLESMGTTVLSSLTNTAISTLVPLILGAGIQMILTLSSNGSQSEKKQSNTIQVNQLPNHERFTVNLLP